jgi:tRNA pseudouridine38-40 synthase
MTPAPRNIRLTLAYDGTAYVGWQIQPNGRSVQDVVQLAIGELTGEPVKLIAAGRTDSGVHALGQVASFRTGSTIPTEKFPAAIQSRLPEDIAVLSAGEASPEFHATYSAVRKTYRYLLHLGDRGVPFLRNYAWRFRHELDLAAMREATEFLLGTHDFRCFETQFPNKATSVRTIEQVEWRELSQWEVWQGVPFDAAIPPEPRSETLLGFEITADGFLYNMVRAIVGTAVDVGRGRFAPGDVRRMIQQGDRSLAGPTAPARGLYLVRVEYDPDNPRPRFAGDPPNPVN